MLADTEPIVSGLQRKMDVFRSFQFDDGEPARCCDRENVEDAAFGRGARKQLRVDKTLIERRIDARDVATNDGFEPAFGLRTIKSVTGVSRQWMAVKFEIV